MKFESGQLLCEISFCVNTDLTVVRFHVIVQVCVCVWVCVCVREREREEGRERDLERERGGRRGIVKRKLSPEL